MKLELTMDESDFTQLVQGAQAWGPHWKPQAQRFESTRLGDRSEPNWNWKMMYAVGTEWLSAMAVRAYLEYKGEECEIVWDAVEPPDASFLVLTNYVGEAFSGLR